MILLGLLVRLWHHLSLRRKWQFGLYASLMIVSAFLEVVSLGAVLPFLGVFLAPEQVLDRPFIANLALGLGITSANELVLLYRRVLYKPYQVQMTINSSSVLASISKVNGSITVLYQFLTLISSIVLLISIMTVLIAINITVAFLAISGFSFIYLLISLKNRKKLYRNSKQIAYQQTQVIKVVQEGLGGIRDVLLNGNQQFYCRIYHKADLLLRSGLGSNAFISGYPRLVVEVIGIVAIALLAYALSYEKGGVVAALPMLAMMALGAQRMLPALQLIYSSWVGMAGTYESLADTVELLDTPLPTEIFLHEPKQLIFQDTIRFKSVSFRYTNDAPFVLDGIDFEIKKGAKVGIVGTTGGGKSTLLDLMMGLLMPSEGEILVDGLPIDGRRLRSWQNDIAHVPQSIYLADTTLAENIAFGTLTKDIDYGRVKQAARQAKIAEFIERNPDGYQAKIGERGIKLSGGQRQRIGIARALYKKASVLVLDEATSALDNITEESVMDSIEGLGSNLTILIIAHRLTTVRSCDIILQVEKGRLVARGNYEQLVEQSSTFRSMSGS